MARDTFPPFPKSLFHSHLRHPGAQRFSPFRPTVARQLGFTHCYGIINPGAPGLRPSSYPQAHRTCAPPPQFCRNYMPLQHLAHRGYPRENLRTCALIHSPSPRLRVSPSRPLPLSPTATSPGPAARERGSFPAPEERHWHSRKLGCLCGRGLPEPPDRPTAR